MSVSNLLELNRLLGKILKKNISDEAWNWLEPKGNVADNIQVFNAAFAATSRRLGKHYFSLSNEEIDKIKALRKNFSISGWSIDRLARVWLLMHIEAENEEDYKLRIEALFPAAEMNELVALYSALPVLAFPEIWKERCSEGIRSNIETVLQAIIIQNPFPAEQLDEPAWNQLVLKAFFTNQNINLIIGLDDRRNLKLANTLVDFAHERWAAGRNVPLQLWRCVAPFINDSLIPILEKLFSSENELERKAAILACYESDFEPAKKLLNLNNNLRVAIESGDLNWQNINQ